MKALTIKQPWAHLIIHCGKDIENRDWPTRFRGRIAIHASKRVDALERACAYSFIKHERGLPIELPSNSKLTGGAILGTVEIV